MDNQTRGHNILISYKDHTWIIPGLIGINRDQSYEIRNTLIPLIRNISSIPTRLITFPHTVITFKTHIYIRILYLLYAFVTKLSNFSQKKYLQNILQFVDFTTFNNNDTVHGYWGIHYAFYLDLDQKANIIYEKCRSFLCQKIMRL